jgi:hypothetical protein
MQLLLLQPQLKQQSEQRTMLITQQEMQNAQLSRR